MILIYILSFAFGNELKYDILFSERSIESLEVSQGQTLKIHEYPDAQTAISLTVQYDGKSNCTANDRSIIFDDFGRRFVNVLPKTLRSEPNSDSLQYYRDSDVTNPNYFTKHPIQVAMVRTHFGFIIVTSDHQVFLLETVKNTSQPTGYSLEIIKNTSFVDMRKGIQETEIPIVLIQKIADRVYIVYKTQIIVVSAQNLEFKNVNINVQDHFIQNAYIYDNEYLFLQFGIYGIQSYKIMIDGNLKFLKSFHIHCDQIEFSKHYALILSPEGIQIHIMNITEDELEFNSIMNIEMIGANLMRVKDNILFVIMRGSGMDQLQEYSIHYEKSKYIHMNNKALSGKFRDIVFGQNFAVIVGIDAHLIIYPGIWQKLKKQEELSYESWFTEIEDKADQMIFIPSLRQLYIYNENYTQNSTNQSNNHKFMIALTSYDLAIIPFRMINPYVECTINEDDTRQRELIIQLNSTSCKQKQLNQTEYSELSMCQQTNIYQLKVIQSVSKSQDQNKILIISLIVIIILVILTAIIFAICYYIYKNKSLELKSSMKKFNNDEMSI